METGQATNAKEKENENVIFCGIKPTGAEKFSLQEFLRKVRDERDK